MVSFHKIALLGLFLPCAAACTPAFADRSSAVTGPRVLAVSASPAEALPGDDVKYRILVVDDKGAVAAPSVRWSYCTQPKPTNELNDVASACFGDDPNIIVPLGKGSSPTGTLPDDGCAQFGPDVPHPSDNSGDLGNGGGSASTSVGRPTDPDSTDGYYQPVILQVTADQQQIQSLAETRITCGLAGSTGEQFEAFNKATKSNENPALLGVTLPGMSDAALTADNAATPLAFGPSTSVVLRASWPACPAQATCGDGICGPGEAIQDCPDDCTTPKGCGGSEPFAYLDPESHELVPRHESMRVSWFATAGSFDTDHTGRVESEFAQTSSDNTWLAPAEPGPVFMWVVLRDDRGGVDWQSFRVEVQ
jgi:hypothetical protein